MLPADAIRPEVVFLVNFIIDLFLLWFAMAVSWRKPHPGRLLLVAFAGGALGALPILAPWFWWLLSGPAVLGVSLVLVLILTWPSRINQYLTVLGGLWGALAVAGGLVFALVDRTGGPVAFVPMVLVGAGVGGAMVGALYLWQAYRERREVQSRLYQVRISLRGQTVVLTALADSGNTLRTPVARRPVVVVEAGPLRPYLPPAVTEALTMGWDGLEAIPEPWRYRCQLIPYQAVGNTDGVLLAIEPEGTAVWEAGSGSWIAVDAIIGLATHSLGPEGHYQALLPPQILQEARAK